jgi:hypothetical protein
MIQKRDEARDRPLKVDIVLPERIVGVDEEVLRAIEMVWKGQAYSLTRLLAASYWLTRTRGV